MSALTDTTNRVVTASAELSRLLEDARLPAPTCDEDGVHDFDGSHAEVYNSGAIREARNALINSAHELSRLAMGPTDYLCSLTWSASKIANLGSLVRLRIPERIPLRGSRGLESLVAEVGLPEIITTRLMRYAVANGLFQEKPIGTITHTAASARLATDLHLHDFIVFWATEPSSLLVKLPETLAQKQSLGDKGPHSAANIAFPEYVDLFDYFDKRIDATRRYSNFLAARAHVPCWSTRYLVSAWDWKGVGSQMVVDVGGSAGSTSFLLANAFPSLCLVNQDISTEALGEGKKLSAEKGFESQISFVQHDFFSAQTVKAKAYLFKSILHDWDDSSCVKILRALLPALESQSHVLIGECVMPEPPASRLDAWDHEAKRVEDQLMIAGHGAHERTLQQYQDLFYTASSYFHLKGVTSATDDSVFSLLDFEYSLPN